jgi:F-type H+-transporting ATPase subunit epsilon
MGHYKATAMAKKLQLVVITPEKKILDQAADSAVIPAHDGELGILSDRAPIMCELGVGQVRYDAGGATHRLLVDGGFAQVHHNNVTVLSPAVYAPADITEQVIAKAEGAAAGITGNDDESITARDRARRLAGQMRSMRSTS